MKKLSALLAFVLAFLCLRAEERPVMHIPKDKIDTPVLFGSRLVSVSESFGKVFAPGQRNASPVLVRFEYNSSGVILLKPYGPGRGRGGVRQRRNLWPEQQILFPIYSETEDSYEVGLRPAFSTYLELVSAVPPKMLNGRAIESEVQSAREDSECLQIMGSYCYENGLRLTANCYFIFLRQEPLQGRTVDADKVGYTRIDGPRNAELPILRWNLEGERKVRFYVDKAFPGEWFPYIKEGIEDWNKAFEAIGLADVFEVLPEPADSCFDRNSPLVNMVRYMDVDESNAKGDVLYDPRNGEILQADILWWKDVVDLLRKWRYVQTGAADPAARQPEYPIEMMGPMIRHAICHEMGHVIGLSHNMGASYAYPADSLRSPSFTRKYGTAASVMDYARYNHLATAADVEAGVNLLPPRLGPYDYYAVACGYGDGEPEACRYCYYAPFISAAISPDPSSQAETLGNDLLRSSAAGVDNCCALLGLDGLTEARTAVLSRQYYNYIWLSLSNIGGAVKGRPVNRRVCDKTLAFVLKSLASVPSQLFDENQQKRILDELEGNFLPERVEKNGGEKELKHYNCRLRQLKRKYNINQ